MKLDLYTLYVGHVTTFVLMTTILLLIGLRYRQEQALRIWGVAGVLACAGIALIALRPYLPLWLGVGLANCLLFFSLMLTWVGGVALEHTRLPWRQGLLLAGAVSGVFLLLPFGAEAFAWRILLFSAAYLLFHALLWHSLRRSPHQARLGYRLGRLIVLLLMLTYSVRLLYSSAVSSGWLANSALFAYLDYQAMWLEYAKLLCFIFICFERLEIRLYQQAMLDSLTGLANRRAFHEQAEQRLAANPDAPVALLVMDLDWFKRVNDSHGHLAGDEVLVHFATLLDRHFGHFDAVYGRNGGEEFSVLLSGSAVPHAPVLAETLRRTLAAAPITTSDGNTLQQTVSTGLVVAARGRTPLRELFLQADLQLYAAKEQGRNRVCVSAL
ncbi:GGDEF domain-containing protein [Vogesella indigofera]|uniref:GGDEF domain-containing protein n=1 Tax=Vogesella indigofera TaxID=45465 RepID=UPI00234E6731|nr:GGDEF domain-containing protein [Vogesella indigofera]MDC7698060.1 GGDEF domain-containing protein [Vogesella indigofera]